MGAPRVGVIGGGIAGLAAATVLVERGAAVVVLERERYLGGRAGSWPDALADGTPFEMERGFHAFFRQYYNLRALLRRVDPTLAMLEPVVDYPILGPDGEAQSFRDLPRWTPGNLATLVRRSPYLGWRDLLAIDKRAALEMLRFDGERTYRKWDGVTARAYLDSLGFPPAARRMFFDVFAHSFFNPEATMSAAELLMMFHFYFVGNPEGLLFDVCRTPFSRAFFRPLGAYLVERGAALELGCPATSLARRPTGGFRVESARGPLDVDAVVVATTVPGLAALAEASPDLAGVLPAAASLAVTRPFAVLRLWLDRPTAAGRPPFAGTTGRGRLDNISLYHLFEEDSRAWAAKTGGAVVELHAYAVEKDADVDALRAELIDGLHAFYPETLEAKILEERFVVADDCPAFDVGSDAARPRVAIAPGLALCGDFVKLPQPSALMERAAASGFMAANHVLEPHGLAAEPIRSIPKRGLLARAPRPAAEDSRVPRGTRPRGGARA
jgi:isorenieratene synthase